MTPQSGVGIVASVPRTRCAVLPSPRMYDFVIRTGCAMNSLTRSRWCTSFDRKAEASLVRMSEPERSTTYARTPPRPSSSSFALMGLSESSASTTPIGSWPSDGPHGHGEDERAVRKGLRERSDRPRRTRRASRRCRPAGADARRPGRGRRRSAAEATPSRSSARRTGKLDSASAYSLRSCFLDR